MIDQVSKTLSKWRQTVFGFCNENDCMLSLADYLIDCGYSDFGKPFRNTFNDEKGANDQIEKYGGVCKIVDTTGLKPSKNPVRGDLILVGIPSEIVGICTGDSVAFRTERGTIEIKLKFVKIIKSWKVQNARC